jgi:hypothetical protein
MKSFVKILGLVMVLALTVTPVMADPDADPIPGNGNTDVIVMNMGSTSAEATALYYPPSGVNPEYTANTNLAGKGSFRFAANAAAPLGDNWRGSMVVQSAGEVAAVAEIIWTNGSSGDGTTADAYTGFAAGATVMYIPFAVYSVNSQFTLFSVQNADASAANIRLTFINRNGVTDLQWPPSPTVETIPVQGSKGYDVRDFTALRGTQFWINNCNAGQCFWSGAIRVESTNGQKITAAVTNHNTQYAQAYSAVTSGVPQVYVPSVERRCVDCAWNPGAGQLGDWVGFSVVTVQCLSATPCNMRMRFVGQTANMTNLTLPDKVIQPGAAVAASTRAGNDYDKNLFNALRDNANPSFPFAWAGSAMVETTNSTQVAVVVFNVRPRENISPGTAGASISNAGTQTLLPVVYKIGVCDLPNGLDWRRFTIFRIQNPTANNATDVDIYYYNRNGTLAAQELNRSIPAGTALTRHMRANCNDLAALGDNWEGSVYISADRPLVVTAESYANAFLNPAYGPSWATGYNGYSVSP